MPALTSPDASFGTPAPAFSLPSTDGELWTLDRARGPKGLLIAFICNHCPYVKAIGAKLARDGRALAEIGIGMAAINANDFDAYPDDRFELMGPFRATHGFEFPYLHDATQETARAYGAVCTPDFFGYDAGLTLRFRGRLDGTGASGADAPSELVPAMRQVAETGHGPEHQPASIGCSIKWRN